MTPATCGDYTVTAQLTPWANPEDVLDPSIPPFPIDANCPVGNVPPFAPQVTAYPVHANAGAYSPLYIKISRQDGEQEITGFSTQFPPGLTGNLSHIEKCPEADVQRAREQTGAQAETEPACPQGSEIGLFDLRSRSRGRSRPRTRARSISVKVSKAPPSPSSRSRRPMSARSTSAQWSSTSPWTSTL